VRDRSPVEVAADGAPRPKIRIFSV